MTGGTEIHKTGRNKLSFQALFPKVYSGIDIDDNTMTTVVNCSYPDRKSLCFKATAIFLGICPAGGTYLPILYIYSSTISQNKAELFSAAVFFLKNHFLFFFFSFLGTLITVVPASLSCMVKPLGSQRTWRKPKPPIKREAA